MQGESEPSIDTINIGQSELTANSNQVESEDGGKLFIDENGNVYNIIEETVNPSGIDPDSSEETGG